eukprot:8874650-Alexandrium_andersonii.AAC.1
MSASLVGSEMCIRDRTGAARGITKAAEVVIRDVNALRAAARRGGGGTVSYTHLTLPTICSV